MRILFSLFLVVVLTNLFSGCTKEDKKPWDVYVPDDGPGGGDSALSVIHPFRLHAAPLSAGRTSGKMVLIPAYHDTFRVAGDTTLYHSASGFVDLYGDTAFVTDSFWMDTAEVTKAEWLAIMGDTTDKTPADWPRTDVSWFDAIRYCNKRSKLDLLDTCYDLTGWRPDSGNYRPPRLVPGANGYRLPTEDEWEYAARGGVRDLPYATDNGTLGLTKACYFDSAKVIPASINVIRYQKDLTIRYTWDSLYFRKAGQTSDSAYAAMSSRFQARSDSAYFVRSLRDTGVAPSLLMEYSITYSVRDTALLDTYKVARRIFETASKDSEDVSQEVWFGYFDTTLFLIAYGVWKVVPGQDTAFDTLELRWRYKREYAAYNPATRTGSFYPLSNTEKNLRTISRNEPRDSINLKKGTATLPAMDSLVKSTSFTLDSLVIDSIRGYSDDRYVIQRNTTTYYHLKGSYRLPPVRSVGSYPANPFGLRDMTGNAEEWCWDAFRDFRRKYRVDYMDTLVTPFRSLKGGSCMSGSVWGGGSDLYLNSGFRRGMGPATPFNLFSLRLVRKAK